VLSPSPLITSKNPKIYLDLDGTLMLTYPLIVKHHARRSVPHRPNPLSHNLTSSLSSKSFPHNSLSDPHPLNPVVSILYKNSGGRGMLIHVISSVARDLLFPYFLIYFLRRFFTSLLQSSERLSHVPQTQQFS
jgi:hypothetical protein